MKLQKFRSLGFDVNINVPETVEEYDGLAKAPGACLKDAIGNCVYRGVLAGVRSDFCDALEASSQVKALGDVGTRKMRDSGRKTKVKTTAPDGSETEREEPIYVYDESEAEYVNRIQALLKMEDAAFVAAFQSVIDSVVASPDNAFDPSQTERKAKGPKKLPENYRATAERCFANGNQERVQQTLAGNGITVTFVEETGTDEEQKAARAKNVESLGWGIKADVEAKQKAALAAY